MDYREIEFGKADALEEGEDYPQLLRNAYYDNHNVIRSALKGSTFLFLGYKGSGKSALSQHLTLAQQNEKVQIKLELLKDFPHKSFKKIVQGGAESEAKLPVAWDWLILVKLIGFIYEKEPNKAILPTELLEVVEALREIGLLESENLRDFVTKSSKRSFKINITKYFGFAFDSSSQTNDNDLQFFHIVSYLKKIIISIPKRIRYYYVIDGLDEILTDKKIQYQSLAALLNEVKELNRFFRSNDVQVKIILLCRVDIFEKLPHPNKNKIRQDSAYVFSWYDNIKNPEKSSLIELANRRARLVYPELKDLFQEFFPTTYESRTIYSDLLDYTRHTPRDFLQLLKAIQRFSEDGSVKGSDIQNGIRYYSENYFLPEIKDELVGYLDYSKVDDLIRLFSLMRKRDFKVSELVEISEKEHLFNKKEIENILHDLFECSGIGHIERFDDKPNQFMFKFRNQNMVFNPYERVLMHKGIWKALSLR